VGAASLVATLGRRLGVERRLGGLTADGPSHGDWWGVGMGDVSVGRRDLRVP
jgi:hypothetical protein